MTAQDRERVERLAEKLGDLAQEFTDKFIRADSEYHAVATDAAALLRSQQARIEALEASLGEFIAWARRGQSRPIHPGLWDSLIADAEAVFAEEPKP